MLSAPTSHWSQIQNWVANKQSNPGAGYLANCQNSLDALVATLAGWPVLGSRASAEGKGVLTAAEKTLEGLVAANPPPGHSVALARARLGTHHQRPLPPLPGRLHGARRARPTEPLPVRRPAGRHLTGLSLRVEAPEATPYVRISHRVLQPAQRPGTFAQPSERLGHLVGGDRDLGLPTPVQTDEGRSIIGRGNHPGVG